MHRRYFNGSKLYQSLYIDFFALVTLTVINTIITIIYHTVIVTIYHNTLASPEFIAIA